MKHKEPEKPKEPASPDSGLASRGGQVEPEASSGEAEGLRLQIDNLQKEKDELFGKLQRVSADYANFQKRTVKQTTDTIAYEKERIIKTILPALDNFEHTLQNAISAESTETLVKGVRIIYDQILDVLKVHGVERIAAVGEEFDPSLHEAIVQKAEPERKENMVLEEFQKGYKLNGRVIRPSRVIVNKLPSEQADLPADEEQTGDETTGGE